MKAYYYLFYKLYKFWELVSMSKFLGDFKSVISIIALEIWLLFLSFNIRSLVRNEKLDIEITHFIIITPFIFILIVNYFLFIHTKKWKEYNAEFDQLPRSKNIIGGIIVWAIIILITVGFWTSAYLVQKNVLGM